jgi:[ribosomal protein S5]-alanine N-acetyltransferase
MHVHLETERLAIRPLAPGDGAFIYELLNTEGWLRFIGNRHLNSVHDAERYIEGIINNKNIFYNIFSLKPTGRPIGIVTLLHRDSQPHPDLGFAILPAHGQRGYTLEACRCYLQALAADYAGQPIIGIVVPENTNSIKTLERLGFGYERQSVNEQETLSVYARTIGVTG